MPPKPFLWLFTAIILSSSTSLAQEAAPISTPTAMEKMAATTAIPSGKITLKAAIEKALASSPRIKSAQAGVLASQGERAQAGVWPNPEIGIQAENFAGESRYRGFDSSEVTLGVSQVIELGGKVSGREAVAEQELSLSRLGQNAERLDIIRDTSNSYVNAVAAQEMLKLAVGQKELADDLFQEVRERVNAAREPLIQKSKAEIMLSTASFARERAERELSHAKHVLSNLWGGHGDDFQLEENDLFALIPPMTEADVEAKMDQNPSLQRYAINETRMQAKYELEKAYAIPDPRINVGVRDFRDTGDKALAVGITIPIPIFNSNQGGIERARHEVSKAHSDAQAVKLKMVENVRESLEAQINAYSQAQSLKSTVLPAAEKAFTLSRQGYRAGKFPYLEVLDAQRTLFEVKQQYITSLKEYHTAKAEVERLTARHADYKAKEESHAQ